MKKRSLIIILLIIFPFFSFSQEKWKVWFPTPFAGYIWQKSNTLDLGISLNTMLPSKKKHMWLNFPAGVDLNWVHKINYVSPFIGIKYSCALDRNYNGIYISVFYWRTKINGMVDNRITPEIGGMIYGFVGISYGYNIPVGPNELDNFGRHRITIRFPGF